MPAKAAKRTAKGQAATPERKKQRTDPNLTGVLDGISKADSLPDACRAMLAAVAPSCFTAPAEERHSHQATLVSWIGDVLDGVRAKLKEAVDKANEEASGADQTKEGLDKAAKEVQTALVAAMETVVAEKTAVAEATDGVSAAKAKLSEAQAAQGQATRKGDELRKEVQALEAALQLIKQDEPHEGDKLKSTLVPMVKKLGLEESLSFALPTVCVKPPGERGPFDTAVLGQVQTAIEAKVKGLSAELEALAASEEEPKAAVEAAQGSLDSAEQKQQAAVQQLKDAEASKSQAAASLGEAEKAVNAFVAERAPEEKVRKQTVDALNNFTSYNLECFAVLKAGAGA
uniref:Uncharacterized protein n=1 Tax=Alexandrium catenella TaxID=2925 RepID=A0A7S1S5Y5_ALECA|mmetsp:Transcript_86671/g.230272  ORF Transcript_86671/g.230272 Transcript_86671/m.230272 type:complete len:344 (+) Transcript_86671:112-1143(+)